MATTMIDPLWWMYVNRESLMLMSFLFIELVKRNRKYGKKYFKKLNGVTTLNKSLFFQQYILKINAYNNIH